MRLIDADALIDRLDYCVKEGMGSTIAFTFKHMVEDAPSIDIVRCKECKFWIGHISDDDGFDEGLDECRWRDSEAPDADDFCSYGERKTNAD